MSDNQQPVILDFAQLSKLILKDVSTNENKSSVLKRYSKDEIANFLYNPAKYEKQLRELSNFLYNASPNYKRLLLYMSCLLTFDYDVEPYGLNTEKVNKRKFKLDYQKTIDTLEIMDMSHEFLKVLNTGFKEDAFYGYEHQTSESYFIQKLSPEYCRVSSIEDGVYNYQFDFAFFDKKENEDKLNTYPNEFKKKYNLYKNDKKKYKWQELDSSKTICIKINEELDYVIPPFSTVFEALFDIEDYKRLKKTKTKIDNYMILTHQIPMDEKTGDPNKFLIDANYVSHFHNAAANSLPDEVALITTPMPIEAIRLEKKNTDKDNVAEAERDYFNAAGVSQLLFNSEKAMSSGLSKSIITDEQILFRVLRQLERWVNRKLKNLGTTYKFKAKFLNTTVFNVDEVFEKYLKAAQFGMPVKTKLGASLGMSPSSMSNMMFLENEILQLHDNLVPLSSTHTQSGKGDTGGRPQKSENDIGESGVISRETDGNIRD